jgi:hypothetical protein
MADHYYIKFETQLYQEMLVITKKWLIKEEKWGKIYDNIF